MSKAIIFDFDGVIADSAEANYLAFSKLLKEKGIKPFNKEFLVSRLGIGPKKVLEEFLDIINVPYNSNEISELANEKTKYAIKFVEKAKLIKNLIPFLDSIYKKYRIAIATSNKRDFIIEFLELNNIKKYFKIIVDEDIVSKTKPDPELFLKASESLNILPSDCIVIEDSIMGVEAALKAGMKCIAITTTNGREKLNKANLVIDDFKELTINKIGRL